MAKRDLSNYRNFIEWYKSDNVIKTAEGFRTQCSQYAKAFNKKELYIYFKKEYIN